ncbi:DinB family protein [Paenibacillus sepulcri]|uniref:DinB family protein n=1 Tax=Paenibacillus sepulcri TaxID=359917 RepID=A0ABS7BZC2_9BACL|nr:DinB family protein [Paenibacillus sepulcri]
MTQSILHTGKILRQLVIGQVQGIPEELFDVQPEGFNNTIRWNAGHIVYWMDTYSTLGLGAASQIPESIKILFNSGTQPSDWTLSPPSKEELIDHLSVQLHRISEISPGELDELLKPPFEMGPFRFETAGELYNFAFFHEAIHLGTISSQLKVIQHMQS